VTQDRQQREPSARAPALVGQWEHFPHRADMGVRGHGTTLDEAFASAAEGLTAVVVEPSDVEPIEKVDFTCSASDPELLFYDFMNTIVYEMAVGVRLFSRFRVRVDGNHLQAEAWGEKVDVKRHQPAVEIKGATFTQLAVGRSDDGRWLAQCILDI
jgi:SHS2 domain-containing protein